MAAEESTQPLALPSPPSADGRLLGGGLPSQLEVGGDSVALERLGPMLVNTDGTLARVANWESMAEDERERTMRIVAKRNAKRLEVLRAEGKEVGGVIPHRK